MSNDSLRESLDALRQEIESAGLAGGPVRERLDQLVSALERKMAEPDDADHHESLVDTLRDSIHQLEVEHPRATSILNQIMTTLGGAGI